MNVNVLMGVMNILIFKPTEAQTSCACYMIVSGAAHGIRRQEGVGE